MRQVIATNSGQRGRFTSQRSNTNKPHGSALELLSRGGKGSAIGPGQRNPSVVQPSARIRARPLIADNPELAALVPALSASIRRSDVALLTDGSARRSGGGSADADDDAGVLTKAQFNALATRLGGETISPARLCGFIRISLLSASESQQEAAAMEQDATVREKLHAIAPHLSSIAERIAEIPVSSEGLSRPGLVRRSAMMAVLAPGGEGGGSSPSSNEIGAAQATEAVSLCLTGPSAAGRGGDRLVAFEPLFDEVRWTCGGRRQRLHKVRARLQVHFVLCIFNYISLYD